MNNQARLSHRAIKGGFWVFVLRITQQSLILIRLVVLARLLSPNDFGLMGIALLTMGTIDTLTQTGFEQALIQKKTQTQQFLDTAWTVGVLRGVVLFAALQLVAPYAAAFFASPRAGAIVKAIGISLLLRAFVNVGTVYFQKELEFKKQFVYQFSGRAADFIVAIVAAFILRNVWVLVLAFVAGDLVRLIASYMIHPYRPRIRIDIDKAGDLFGFGKWVLGSGIMMFLLTQGDAALVGKVIGATMLGMYQMAYRISNVPATEISHVIAQVTFPAYAKLQDDLGRLRQGYLRVLQVTAFAAIPVAGLIMVLARPITIVFLGEKWLPATPAMQILAAWGALRALGSTTGPVFAGVGRPKILTKYQSIQLLLLALLIYPMTTSWGIRGTSWSVVVAALVANILALRGVAEMTRCGTSALLRVIALPSGATAVAAAAVFAWGRLGLLPEASVRGFATSCAGFGVVYLTVVYAVGAALDYRLTPLIREIATIIRARQVTPKDDRWKA